MPTRTCNAGVGTYLLGPEAFKTQNNIKHQVIDMLTTVKTHGTQHLNIYVKFNVESDLFIKNAQVLRLDTKVENSINYKRFGQMISLA